MVFMDARMGLEFLSSLVPRMARNVAQGNPVDNMLPPRKL